jgi:hypothetical protein
MNSYFCMKCNLVHLRSFSTKESILKSGFHYVNLTLYNAGVCSSNIKMSSTIEDRVEIRN